MGIAASSAAAGAAAQAVLSASRACGIFVVVDADEFSRVLDRIEKPLVVVARRGRWNVKHDYLTSYRGLAFFTRSDAPVALPEAAELVEAKKIWIPQG